MMVGDGLDICNHHDGEIQAGWVDSGMSQHNGQWPAPADT